MTFSTESSAASASGNNPDVQPPGSRTGTGGVFLGMDEAGYGPNLGPLLISVTRWETPGSPHECDFYQLLNKSVTAQGNHSDRKLHLADSKLVNVGKQGFRSLERSALALLQTQQRDITSFDDLYRHLTGSADRPPTETSTSFVAPWYREPLPLPVCASPLEIDHYARLLHNNLQESGIRLTGVRMEFIEEQRFNHLVAESDDNKGRMLSRQAFRLLRSIWSPAAEIPTLIVGDKHGGRNRYDGLLAEILDDAMIFRLEEGQRLSRYRVGSSELRFQVGGESHLPVACASVIAKYVRELSMMLFNRFWSRHCPEVRPTLGYPQDARRFRQEMEHRLGDLGIEAQTFWRTK